VSLLVVFSVVAAVIATLLTYVIARAMWWRELRNRTYAAMMRLGLHPRGAETSASIDDLFHVIDRGVREMQTEGVERDRTELRLRAALDGLPEAVMIFDGEGTVLEHNLAANQFLEARHADALVGAAITGLVRLAVTGEQGSRSLDLFGPPRRSVVVTTIPLLGVGDPSVVVVVEDVTERRQLDAIRTDFVANISHELKTPVGAIGLLAETLLDEDDPAIIDRLATRIQGESIRMAGIIEDLLELSRIEIRVDPDFMPVSIDVVIAESVERLRVAAQRSGVTVHVLPSVGDVIISGDQKQLVSAVSNLIDNSIKYSDSGSAIEIEAVHDSGAVELSVTDHGIGIPTKDVERVFERFYRVDHARSRQTGGTGLGLSIVRNVVANHEATVEVESRLGEGSTFRIRFPMFPRNNAVSATLTNLEIPDERT